MPSHHFSAFVSPLLDRGGTPRDRSGPAAAGRRKRRLCRCLLWIVLQRWEIFFFCWISAQIRTKFFRSPDDPKLQGALLTCMSLINTAGLPINVRQKKEKKTVSIKTKTKTLPLSLVARKVLENAFFFPLLFFNKCGKHDSFTITNSIQDQQLLWLAAPISQGLYVSSCDNKNDFLKAMPSR